MPDILSGVKNLEGQSIEKGSLSDNSMSWLNSEPSLAFEIITYILKLRDSFNDI